MARELGARVVERAAERAARIRVAHRPLLAGARRIQHRDVDALEVHVGQARHRVVHAGAHRRAELEVVLGRGATSIAASIFMPPPGRSVYAPS